MICSRCYQPFDAMACPYCALGASQFVGQAAVANPYQTASWTDLDHFLFPLDWALERAGKLIYDPSQSSDMIARRQQMGAVAQQLNNVVKACPALPDVDKQNWAIFAQQFVPWFNKSVPSTDDAQLDVDQANALQDQLSDWQAEIGKYCDTGMPFVPHSSPTLGQLGQQTLGLVGKYLDTFKWVVLVGAGVFAVSVAILGVDGTRKIVMKAVG